MDDRLLAAFCAVADHGSLTRASAALGEAQSALSRRISALEAQVRGRLFHRTGRGAVPTALGNRLLPRARAILDAMAALAAEAGSERDSPSGRVDLGVVPGMSRPLVSELCATLRATHPRIRLRAVEAYSGDVETWLAEGRVDIGIFNRYGHGRVRDAEMLLESEIMLVAARGRHRLPRGELAFRLLRELPLALPPRPNALVTRLADLAARHHFALDIAFEAASGALVHDAVAHAGLCTLVPSQLVARDYADATVFEAHRVVKPTLRQLAWLATTAHRPASEAARVVAQLLRALAVRRKAPVGPARG
jgi:DNA-binding transcriptional LysR family regulator